MLKGLHDEIDLCVLEAYGWADLAGLMQVVNGNSSAVDCPAPAPENQNTTMTRTEAMRQLDEALLERLVALNAARAAEEKRGLIRYLRPDFQDPNFKAKVPEQVELAIPDDEQSDDEPSAIKAVKATKTAWPKTLPDQVRALLDLLKTQTLPAAQIAQNFSGIKAPKLGELLQTLVDMGRLRETKDGFSM